MLSSLNPDDELPRRVVAGPEPEGPGAHILASALRAGYGKPWLHRMPVGDPDRPDQRAEGWVGTTDLLIDPGRLGPLVDASCRRFASQDRALVLAQVAREAVSSLTAVAVELWVLQRRVLDLSAANVVLRAGKTAVVAGLRQPTMAVLADDPMAGGEGIDVVGEDEMFDQLVDQCIGYPVPAGRTPPGRPGSIAAVAAIISTVRRLARCGDRHLWGTAGLAVASTTARLSHTLGPRADQDRAALLGARPDLDRTIELITVDDGCPDARLTDSPAGEITFARRRTCCLLFKLPDAAQCATCSLHDRDCQVAELSDWYRRQRRELRSS